MKLRLRVTMKIDGEIRHMLVPVRKEVTIRNAVKDIGKVFKVRVKEFKLYYDTKYLVPDYFKVEECLQDNDSVVLVVEKIDKDFDIRSEGVQKIIDNI